MQIKRVGTQASAKGPSEWFTGTVRIDPLFSSTAPGSAAGNAVTFERCHFQADRPMCFTGRRQGSDYSHCKIIGL